MNCKPGDLAYVVAPYAVPGRGRVVTVIRAARYPETLNGFEFYAADPSEPGWVCQGAVPNVNGVIRTLLVIADCSLRPILDPGSDATDESKAWLPPVPSLLPAPKETAA